MRTMTSKWGAILWTAGFCLARPAAAATINVPAGGNFQSALNTAVPGDVIVLQAGATYATGGGFNLPDKGNSTQLITIQSSDLASLPAAGYRVHPADAPRMPKLMSSINASPIIDAAPSAHHYQFIGIEFAQAPGTWSYSMIRLGAGDEADVALLPHHIFFDRCYAHGDPTAQPGTKRAFQFNGSDLTLINSYVSEIHLVGQDAQALAAWNGPGPFMIVNNYLEASGENILFGGNVPGISGLIQSDIEIRNNHLIKPLSWKVGHPSYAGIHWSIKNIFELKNAQRLVIESNIFENCWSDAQVGFAILFTPKPQGSAPWSVVKDVTFTRNIIRHASSGINILSEDYNDPSQVAQNILIRDIIMDDINPTTFGGDGRLFQLTTPNRPATDITIDHVTGLLQGWGNGFGTVGDCCTVADRFKFNNSIVSYGAYGFKGSGVGEGISALTTYFTNYEMSKNAIIGGGQASAYPPGNFFPADANAVGFTDFAASDYRLTAASPYKNAGTDGKDIGADIDLVLRATCGVRTGVPTSTCSSGPLPPLPRALPTPTLSLPIYLPVNGTVTAGYPAGYGNIRFSWTFTATAPPAASAQQTSGVIGRASAASLLTATPQASLASSQLIPGYYSVSVQAVDASGYASFPAQAFVTLVSADLAGARIYPNPWRSDRHAQMPITFDGLTVNTTIKIFTVSGHLVKTLPASNTSVTWDLTNAEGKKVASGLYLYLMTTDQGNKRRGKFAIIR